MRATMKRYADVLEDLDVSTVDITAGRMSSDSPFGMLSSPLLGPMTPLHSPSSEEEFQEPKRLGAFSMGSTTSRRASLGNRRASLGNRRSSLSSRRASLGQVRADKENQCASHEPPSYGKRAKLEIDLRPPLGNYSQFQVSSTASTTAGSTPSTPSPLLSPANTPQQIFIDKLPQVDDYNGLSVEELRDRLGVTGTDIVSGWDKEDLVSAVQALEEVISGMPSLSL